MHSSFSSYKYKNREGGDIVNTMEEKKAERYGRERGAGLWRSKEVNEIQGRGGQILSSIFNLHWKQSEWVKRRGLFRDCAEFSRNIKPAESKINMGNQWRSEPPNDILWAGSGGRDQQVLSNIYGHPSLKTHRETYTTVKQFAPGDAAAATGPQISNLSECLIPNNRINVLLHVGSHSCRHTPWTEATSLSSRWV